MKYGDIVAIDDGTGGTSRIACVLSWGPKTFDVVIECGGTERYWHSAVGRNTRAVRPATLHDFGGDQKYMQHAIVRLRKEAADAREERRTGARIKRGQLWPSH